MTLEALFQDKSIKSKGKVSAIGEWLLNGELSLQELLNFADKQSAVNKASCIEAVEYATKKDSSVANEKLVAYITNCLTNNEPRIKWESAKVIGNIARLFPAKLEEATTHLLANTGHTGTVVRWASAYALGEIIKLKTQANETLLPKMKALCEQEQDNGVKKKYLDALKKLRK